ncbi:MAG: T9SS type A sorting domain-containing protein [Calditrichaeota bacterium]|nr:T9SS type A sorting domain-containing protein [Calditrichota bacterium]
MIILYFDYSSQLNVHSTLRYQLPQNAEIRLSLIDAAGRLVWDETLPGEAGVNRITIDASLLPAGVYLIRLEALNYIERAKVILLK